MARHQTEQNGSRTGMEWEAEHGCDRKGDKNQPLAFVSAPPYRRHKSKRDKGGRYAELEGKLKNVIMRVPCHLPPVQPGIELRKGRIERTDAISPPRLRRDAVDSLTP